jgi:hypothetical protein
MSNDHSEMSNVKAQMPKGKIQMTNDGARNTNKDNEHGHETRTLSEGEFAQQPIVWRGASFPVISIRQFDKRMVISLLPPKIELGPVSRR